MGKGVRGGNGKNDMSKPGTGWAGKAAKEGVATAPGGDREDSTFCTDGV